MLTGRAPRRKVARRNRTDRPRWGERGQVMLLVVALIAIASTIPAVVVATSIGQLGGTSENLNWNAAYEAAEAGVNDYIQQLDASPSGSFIQWSRGMTTCPPSKTNADDAAFCGWVPVEYQTNPPEWFEYSLPSTNGGGLMLTVSGEAGTGSQAVVRTFTYRIVPEKSFLDNIYWTQYESFDPQIEPSCPPDEFYSSSSTPPQSCWIQFDSNDTLNGPTFSDDTFRICGDPVFNGTVYSAASTRGQPGYVAGESCSVGSPAPTVNSIGDEPMPGTSAEAAEAADVGCYIAGSSATSPASNVTITLTPYPAANPTTTEVTWSGSGDAVYNSPSNTNSCASSGFTVLPSALSPNGLLSGLVYVLGNVTITANSKVAGFLTIVAGAVDSQGDAALGSSQAGMIYLTGNITYNSAFTTSGPCSCYVSDSNDGLGLVAYYDVEYNNGGSEPCPGGGPPSGTGLTIDAALLALNDSVYNPYYASGAVCKLNVNGSIAQNYRGVVGQISGSSVISGYEKDYVWDSSWQAYWPPYFLSPTSATWAPSSYAEDKPGCASRALGSVTCTA